MLSESVNHKATKNDAAGRTEHYHCIVYFCVTNSEEKTTIILASSTIFAWILYGFSHLLFAHHSLDVIKQCSRIDMKIQMVSSVISRLVKEHW